MSESAQNEAKAILAGTNDAFVRTDNSGRITDWNPAASAIFGYDKDQVLGKTLTETIIPEDLHDAHFVGIEWYLSKKTARVLGKRTELPAMKKDGSRIVVEATINALDNGRGGFFAFLHDITHRKHIEDELARSNALMQAMLDNTSAVVFAKDLEGKYVFVNGQYEKFFNINSSDIVGKTDHVLLPADVAEQVRENDQKVIASDSSLTMIEHISSPTGIRQFLSTKFPVRDAAGRITGVCGIAIDDTDRIRNEELLRDARGRYERTIANVPGMVYRYLKSADGTAGFPYVSSESLNFLGFEPDAIISDPSLILENIHPEDAHTFFKNIEESAENMTPWQWDGRIIGADGKPRWVSGISRPHAQQNGDIAWDGILIDHTEEKRIEKALAESRANFDRVVSQLRDYVFTVAPQPDGSVKSVFASPDSSGVLGGQLDMSKDLARTIADMVHPDDLHLFVDFNKRVRSGQPIEVECRIIGLDGVVRWVWTRLRSRLDGTQVLVDGICSNVTERRQLIEDRTSALSALSKRNDDLERANQFKLDLMSMLSHDIGNPITVIKGYTELVLGSDEVTAATKTMMEAIKRSTETVDALRREVLAMCEVESGLISAHREPVLVNSVLHEVITDLGSSARIDCDETLYALVRPLHFRQMIANFLTNADKYGGGATLVSVISTNKTLELRVYDEGPGVPDAFLDQLFQRASRAHQTKNATAGSGFGLFIVKSLVEANGGEVWYETNVPTGSIFAIRLERAPGK